MNAAVSQTWKPNHKACATTCRDGWQLFGFEVKCVVALYSDPSLVLAIRVSLKAVQNGSCRFSR